MNAQDDLMPQYVVRLAENKYVIFTLANAMTISGCYILYKGPYNDFVEKMPNPPIELTRPGISPQYKNGNVDQIMLIGGGKEKQCFVLDLRKRKWFEIGKLPLFHLVTEQINV